MATANLVDLESNMASLDLQEPTSSSSTAVQFDDAPHLSGPLRRSSNRAIAVAAQSLIVAEKRRVSRKPAKLSPPPPDDDRHTNTDAMNDFYLDKSVKRVVYALETVYEEPDDGQLFSSKRRSNKHTLSVVHQMSTAAKLMRDTTRRRAMKARSVSAMNRSHKKFTMEFLLTKLASLNDRF